MTSPAERQLDNARVAVTRNEANVTAARDYLQDTIVTLSKSKVELRYWEALVEREANPMSFVRGVTGA